MQKNIKYIGFYKCCTSERNYSLAATNKMDYIASSLVELGMNVKIISPSWIVSNNKNTLFDSGKTFNLSNNLKLKTFLSWNNKTKFGLYLKIIFSLSYLFFYLIFNTKKNEKVLLYHSQWIALPVLLAKKIKNFHLILEIEEIYAEVSSINSYLDKLEHKIIEEADSYFLSNDLLAEKINLNTNFLVIYGSYKFYSKLSEPINDNKIHVVYTGIIDSEKLGAFNAVESALFLNENYIIHILGFGEIDKLEKRISEINAISKCKVVFEGQKTGDDFISFCQSCHIGLSTQKLQGSFSDSSFPSKILSYLGMGLQVVSGYVTVVAKSKISNNVSFYTIDSPSSIAQAIMNINIKESSSEKMKNLDLNFKKQLLELLNNV